MSNTKPVSLADVASTLIDSCNGKLTRGGVGGNPVAGFERSSDAWAFSKAIDDCSMTAGFPSLKPNASGLYTVEFVMRKL